MPKYLLRVISGDKKITQLINRKKCFSWRQTIHGYLKLRMKSAFNIYLESSEISGCRECVRLRINCHSRGLEPWVYGNNSSFVLVISYVRYLSMVHYHQCGYGSHNNTSFLRVLRHGLAAPYFTSVITIVYHTEHRRAPLMRRITS